MGGRCQKQISVANLPHRACQMEHFHDLDIYLYSVQKSAFRLQSLSNYLAEIDSNSDSEYLINSRGQHISLCVSHVLLHEEC